MKDGIIKQVDSPANLYNKPANMFVASFIGSPQMNMVDVLVEQKGESIYLMMGEFPLKLNDDKARRVKEGGYVDKTVVMGIRPEDLKDDEAFISRTSDNLVDADVEVTELLGAEVYLYLQAVGQPMTARVDPRTTAKPGDRIKVAFDLNKIHIFDKETEEIISN
jgi:multiple sugar transport system ATP-binding protein